MHRDIKRFGFDGIIGDDADFGRLREEFELRIISEMRDKGYVQSYDNPSEFSTTFVDGKYSFVISVFGIFVGKRQACHIEGIMNGNKPIVRSKSAKS